MNQPGQPASPAISLPPEQFAAAFPFHLALDRKLKLVQAGSTLRRICPDVQPGADLDQIFRSIRPEGRMTLEWVRQHGLRFFLLEHRTTKLQLRGEFILLPEQDTLLFLGSPWFTDSSEIATRGLGFEDFAIHDPAVDMLQVLQASKMALADAKKLAAKLIRQREELRAANERLRQQEANTRKLALIAARTDNAVVLTDAEGRTEWVNEGFTRLTGYTLEEVLGKKPGALLQGPGTDPETVRHMGERLRKGESFSAEILNYSRDGRSYWLAIEVQPIHDDQGRLTNFMAIETDITERRRVQQRLAIQFEVSRVLVEEGSFATAIPEMLKAICESLGWQVGMMWRIHEDRLRFVEVWHPPAARMPEFIGASRTLEFERGVGLPGRIWAEARPRWILDVTREANFPRGAEAAENGLRGAFGFPVFVRRRVQSGGWPGPQPDCRAEWDEWSSSFLEPESIGPGQFHRCARQPGLCRGVLHQYREPGAIETRLARCYHWPRYWFQSKSERRRVRVGAVGRDALCRRTVHGDRRKFAEESGCDGCFHGDDELMEPSGRGLHLGVARGGYESLCWREFHQCGRAFPHESHRP